MSARALTVSYLALWLATLDRRRARRRRRRACKPSRRPGRRSHRASPPSRELVEHNALVALWPLALVALGWPELPGARTAGDLLIAAQLLAHGLLVGTALGQHPAAVALPAPPAAGVARARDPRRRLADRAHPPRAPQPPARGPGRRRRAASRWPAPPRSRPT